MLNKNKINCFKCYIPIHLDITSHSCNVQYEQLFDTVIKTLFTLTIKLKNLI